MIHKQTQLTLYLIRHAESEMNQNPHLIGGRSPRTPLSPLGIEQAMKLGKYFHKHDITFNAIYSSTAVRAIGTARLVLKEFNVPEDNVTTTDQLVEIGQGDWEGKLRTETYTPDTLSYMNTKGPIFTPPNGESQLMCEHRVSSWFIEEILNNKKYMGKETTIAIFSHGITIKCLLHFVMHFNDRLIYRITLDNTSMCRLRLTPDGWFIDSINDTSHLGQ